MSRNRWPSSTTPRNHPLGISRSFLPAEVVVAFTQPVDDSVQGTDAITGKAITKAIADGIQADDATSIPSGVIARRFVSDPGGESGDELRTAIGACNLNAGATVVAWVRKVNDPPVREAFIGTHTSGGVLAADLTTGIIPDDYNLLAYGCHSSKVGDELTFVRDDGWSIVAFVHPAGTNTLGRFHALKEGVGSWEHVEAKEPQSNKASQAGGSVRFASISGFAYTDLEIAAAALWTTALSDGQIEELTTSLTDWLGHSVPPVGLWRFNQASIATPLVDLTGNGADQTSIDGTVVSTDGPPDINYDIAFARSVDDTAQGTDATGKALTKAIADTIAGTDAASVERRPSACRRGPGHRYQLEVAGQGRRRRGPGN